MKNKLIKGALVAAACAGANAAAAQSSGSLAGAVADSLTKQPVPYATVVIKKYDDAKYFLNTMTDDKGSFSFDNVPDGKYYLSGMYLGYKNFLLDSVNIRRAGGPAPQLTVLLAPDRKLLKNVTVVGNKPFIEQHADKVVLNVAESPIATGGNASDVLSRAPGVIEQGGSYVVRGKAVTVLVDGKLTNLSGSDLKDMLSALPSNTLDKVEVIANPSAKYDAQGGAVINILTKKNKAFGTNGSYSAGVGAGRFLRYNSGLSLNHRAKNINVFGGYDYQYNQQYTRSTADRVIGGESRITEATYETRQRNNNSARIGFDYDINKKSSFGVLVKGALNYRDKDGEATNQLGPLSGPVAVRSQLLTDGRARFLNPSVNVYYRTVLDSVGSDLRLNADYFNYRKQLHDDYTGLSFDGAGNVLTPPGLLQNNSPAQNTVRSLSADYTHPFGKDLLEAGAKSIFTTTDNDIFWQNQLADGSWLTDVGKTNHFIYRENINAAYVNYSKKIRKVSLQAGVRVENTSTEGESLTLHQVNRRNYTNLFPSVALQFNKSDKQQWGLSYQRKIDRFQFDIVNPFVTYISQYNYYQGNPAIRPSISNNFSLTHTYNNEVSTALSYSQHSDVLAEVYRREAGSNVVISSMENLSSAVSVDGSLNLTKQLLANKWTTVNTLGAMYAKYHTATDPLLNQAKLGWYLSSNNSFRLAKGYKAEVFAFYYSPLAYGAYRFKAQYGNSLGVSKTILKDAGTLTLNVSDPFNVQARRFAINTNGISSDNYSKVESRFVKLNFTYKFGSKTVKGSKSRKTGIDDVKSRMETN